MRVNSPILTSVVGFCLILLGVLSTVLIPKLATHLIKKETAMKEGSKAFESWKKIPFPFKFKVYLFNVTNPRNIQEGSNPIVKEIGPYVYDEFRVREIMSFDEYNDTLKFNQTRRLFFNKEDSKCRSESDLITIVNIGLLGIVHKVNKLSPSLLSMVDNAIPFLFPNITNIFITASVKDILFTGVKISCESEDVDMICEGIKSNMPASIRQAPNNRDFLISFFYHMNHSVDGPYDIQRGLKSDNKGVLVSFKNQTHLTEWGPGSCSEIKGTDLTLNPAMWTKPKSLDFFVSDFCRSFSVTFKEEKQYKDLITYSFENNNLFENVHACFCTEKESDLPECGPVGTMDVSLCTKSSVILSQPHFLNGEESLLNYVHGLKPNISNHGNLIIIEPKTGLALSVKTRFQMNTRLQRFQDIQFLQNVSEGIFPLIWIEEDVEIPQRILDELKDNFSKLKMLDYLKVFPIGLGVFFLVISLAAAAVKDRFFCRTNTVEVTEKTKMEQLGAEQKFINQQNSVILVSKNDNTTKNTFMIYD